MVAAYFLRQITDQPHHLQGSMAARNPPFIAPIDPFQMDPDVLHAAMSLTAGGLIAPLAATDGPDTLIGTSGDDTMDGGLGADQMEGQSGNDTYLVDDELDTVLELPGSGIDLVISRAEVFRLPSDVEQMQLSGPARRGIGNDLDNILTGSGGDNKLRGEAGNDLLNGMGGNDTLLGGWGNDTLEATGGIDLLQGELGDDLYRVNNLSTTIVELAGEGSDHVETELDGYVLPDNVEFLWMLGQAVSGFGNDVGNVIAGNDRNNLLDGGEGWDRLIGGRGNDVLEGRGGNDHLIGEEGNDTLRGAASPDELEGGSGDDLLEGGNDSDRISGGSGRDVILAGDDDANDRLWGDGGADLIVDHGGRDTIYGGEGDDTIYAGEGDDSLYGGDGADLMYGEGGTFSRLYGDAGRDTLYGGDGFDELDGGAGADLMAGGASSDDYVVDSTGDVVVEDASYGYDEVRAYVDFTLPDHVEDLELKGSAYRGFGNDVDNWIVGTRYSNRLEGRGGDDYLFPENGDDIVDGGSGDDYIQDSGGNDMIIGGDGNDVLIGGAGGDWFFLDSIIGSDEIIDFDSAAGDRLRILQDSLPIGNGDTVIDDPVTSTGYASFGKESEVVFVAQPLTGGIDIVKASAAIGYGQNPYDVGEKRLFVVQNTLHSAVYLFTSDDGDADIEAGELTLLATVLNTPVLMPSDLLFGP